MEDQYQRGIILILLLIVGSIILFLALRLIISERKNKLESAAKMVAGRNRELFLSAMFPSLKKDMTTAKVGSMLGKSDKISIFVRENGDIRKEFIYRYGSFPNGGAVHIEFVNDHLVTMSKH